MRSCILIYVSIFEGRWIINGSFIDAIEYFLSIYEHNKNIDLVFLGSIGSDRGTILNLIKDRYDLSGLEGWEERVVFKKHLDILRIVFNRVLVVDYTTIKKTKGLLRANEIHVIVERYTENKEYMYNKSLQSVTYWGEMPFEYRDKEYRMKLLFDRIKKPRDVKDQVYLTYGPILKNSGYDQKIDTDKVLKEKGIIKSVFLKKSSPTDNFFEQFNMLVYIKTAKSEWDTHPRIFVECAYFEKEIIYDNQTVVKDGSYYRYNDTLINGARNRTLNKDDEIISLFSSEL